MNVYNQIDKQMIKWVEFSMWRLPRFLTLLAPQYMNSYDGFAPRTAMYLKLSDSLENEWGTTTLHSVTHYNDNETKEW